MKRKGFTIIELALVIGMIVILSLAAFSNLSGRRNKTEINGIMQQMGAVIREAQSKSVSQVNGSIWGVHFENSVTSTPFFALFNGAGFVATSSQSYLRLPPDVSYVTSTLNRGSKLDITFAQISGFPSATATISIYVTAQPNVSSTLTINSSGAVTF